MKNKQEWPGKLWEGIRAMRTNSARYIWEHILSHQWLKECGTRMLIERQMEEYRQKTHT